MPYYTENKYFLTFCIGYCIFVYMTLLAVE